MSVDLTELVQIAIKTKDIEFLKQIRKMIDEIIGEKVLEGQYVKVPLEEYGVLRQTYGRYEMITQQSQPTQHIRKRKMGFRPNNERD